ncbi:MAG: hypothetical protein WAW23_11465 [Candidatus Methanoperedens sp.]
MDNDEKEIKQEQTKQQEKSDNEWPSARLIVAQFQQKEDEK